MQRRHDSNILRVHHALALVAPMLLCVACGGADPASPALVCVNDDEITARQLDYVLAQLPAEQRADERMSRKVMEDFIDQQLLLQQALRAELDREPRVAQTLDHLRRQVLAQAYLEHVATDLAPPPAAEVDTYYRDHPELFAQRKVYALRQIIADKSTVSFEELKERSTGHHGDPDEVVRWLRKKNALLRIEASLTPAEEIPPEVLTQLHVLVPGTAVAWRAPQHHVVVVLLGATMEPVTQREAAPLIREFLLDQRRKEVTEQELARLRQQAAIRWLREPARHATASAERHDTEEK